MHDLHVIQSSVQFSPVFVALNVRLAWKESSGRKLNNDDGKCNDQLVQKRLKCAIIHNQCELRFAWSVQSAHQLHLRFVCSIGSEVKRSVCTTHEVSILLILSEMQYDYCTSQGNGTKRINNSHAHIIPWDISQKSISTDHHEWREAQKWTTPSTQQSTCECTWRRAVEVILKRVCARSELPVSGAHTRSCGRA